MAPVFHLHRRRPSTGSAAATPRSCDPAPPRSPRRTPKPHAPSHLRTGAPSSVLTHSGRILPCGCREEREEQQEQRGAAERQPPAHLRSANPAGPHSACGLADRSVSQEPCVGKILAPEVGGAGGTRASAQPRAPACPAPCPQALPCESSSPPPRATWAGLCAPEPLNGRWARGPTVGQCACAAEL